MHRRHFCQTLLWSGAGLAGPVTAQPVPGGTGAEPGGSFLYILRLGLAPGHQVEARAAALVRFCQEARIDDVAFILWAEELNSGHPTPQETAVWLELVQQLKPRLDSIGVSTSLNPWAVLLHADRGRRLKAGQEFQLMVDPRGFRASANACPLCPNLREHLVRHFGQLAAIRPRIIWVDDDFRLHNHAPLQWGGCFCPLHMAEYSRRAGRELTREEFVSGVLQPGTPHPYRRVWLETSRDTMVELAGLLGQAVRRVSPTTQVGLMSSNPAVHCVEGRDWEGVLRGFAAGLSPVNRPHLPAYEEVAAPRYLWNFSRVSRLTSFMVPSDTRMYPELENWPHSRFSKSWAFSRFQVEACAAMGAQGIAMDIFDLFGNGVLPHEDCAPTLAAAKQLAIRLRELGLDLRRETGVQVLFNRQASASVTTRRGEAFSELEPDETFWASFLAAMGVAHTYREPTDVGPGWVAVSGQYFRGLDESRIRSLVSAHPLLLNGDAVDTLVQMGLGELLGIRGLEWLASDSGIPSYEQVIDGRAYAGLQEARLTAQARTGAYLRIDYGTEVAVHTEVRNPSGEAVGPGVAVVAGRTVVLPYGRSSDSLGLLHPVRQELLQHLMTSASVDPCPVYLLGPANVAVYSYALEGRLVLLLVNASLDGYGELRIHCPAGSTEGAAEVSAEGIRSPGRRLVREGDRLRLRSGLPALAVKALVLRL